MADLVEQCALLAFQRGRTADAARMLGCADASLAASHQRRDPVEKIVYQTLVHSPTNALPAAELAALEKDGEALSHEEAVRLALRD